MVFLGHIALSTTIVTFCLGLVILGWSKKEACASSLCKIAGIAVIALSLLNFLCVGYNMLRYWEDGSFKTCLMGSNQSGDRHGGGMDMKQHQKMMQDMMMKKNMMGNKPPMQNPDDVPPDHEEHHP